MQEKSKPVIPLTILKGTKILFCFGLVLGRKAHEDISGSSRLEFL